jgi:hypothetical protein
VSSTSRLKVDAKLPLPPVTYSEVRWAVFAFGSLERLRNTLTHGWYPPSRGRRSLIHPDLPPDRRADQPETRSPSMFARWWAPTRSRCPNPGETRVWICDSECHCPTAFRQLKQYGRRRQEVGIGRRSRRIWRPGLVQKTDGVTCRMSGLALAEAGGLRSATSSCR